MITGLTIVCQVLTIPDNNAYQVLIKTEKVRLFRAILYN